MAPLPGPRALLAALLAVLSIVTFATVIDGVFTTGSDRSAPNVALFTPSLVLSAWTFSAALIALSFARAVEAGIVWAGPRGIVDARHSILLRDIAAFVFIEALFELVLSTGHARVWVLTNAAGRTRLVYPLRYVAWSSTNAYLVSAVAVALRMSDEDALRAVIVTVVALLAALPLELVPTATPAWLVIFTSAWAFFFYASALVGSAIYSLVRELISDASRTHAAVSVSVISVLSFSVALSYLSVPIVFIAALLCGGDGVDGEEGGGAMVGRGATATPPLSTTCLSVHSEAYVWRVVEGTAKLLFLATILLCSVVVAALSPLSPSNPCVVTVSDRWRPQHANTWVSVVLEHSLVILVTLMLTFGGSIEAQGAYWRHVTSSPDFHPGVLAYIFSGILAITAAILLLDHLLQSTRDRALIEQMLPEQLSHHGFLGDRFNAAVVYNSEPHVTVFFADVCGYTDALYRNGGSAPSEETLVMIATLYRALDALHASIPGVHKVETVGDAYMSVCGASFAPGRKSKPLDAGKQALLMAQLAIDAVAIVEGFEWPDGSGRVRMRFGLHAGPSSTAVFGGTLPRWTVFGHTVNLASRMQSTGTPGRVHVSRSFAETLSSAGDGAQAFIINARAQMSNVKGVGPVETFYVEAQSGVGGGKSGGGGVGCEWGGGSRAEEPRVLSSRDSRGWEDGGAARQRVSRV